MSDLTNAVAKTMNFVFADIEESTNEKAKRLTVLRANLGKVANIPIDEIITNENIRKSIDTNSESFLRLVESIKRYGVLENIVAELRLNKKESDYKLVCIAGHRRILAAKAAQNITRVPCLLQAYTIKGDNVGAALAENLNREDLHCLDVADGYRELLGAGWTEEDLAQHFCRDIRTIKHYIKMSQWTEEIKNLLREHPSVFSTRVIMRQFAYRRVNSTAELKAAIKSYIAPSTKKTLKKEENTKAAKAQSGLERKVRRVALMSYLSKQETLSSIIKDEIKRAFLELDLI